MRALGCVGFLLCVTAPTLFYGEEERPPLSLVEALQILQKADSVDWEDVGYAGGKTNTYRAYEVFRDDAHKTQIEGMLEDKSPVLRVYAFWALRSRWPKEDLFPVLYKHLPDEESIKTHAGCIVMEQRVGDLFYQEIEGALTAEQRARILDYLMTHESRLALKNDALQCWTIGPEYRKQVVALYRQGNEDALIGLARFQCDEDVVTIRKALEMSPWHALRAITHFPNQSLFPDLLAMQQKVLDGKLPFAQRREFFAAVAAYRNKAALEVLQAALKPGVDDDTVGMVLGAAHWSYVPLYDDLLFQLWGDFNSLNLAVFERLVRADRNRSVAAARKWLTHLDQLPVRLESADEIIKAVANFWIRSGTDDVLDVLKTAITKASVHAIGPLLACPVFPKDDALLPALFSRYEGEANPHIFLAAAEAILAYGREDLKQRLRDAVDKHPPLQSGWGGDRLKALLIPDRKQTNDKDR